MMRMIVLMLVIVCTYSKQCFAQTFKGKVFLDANSNRKFDKGEKGIAGVLVSNGMNVVKTNTAGDYILDTGVKNNFIFITTPNGYKTGKFYYRFSDGQTQYDFALQQLSVKKKTVSFIHITDTETPDYGSWIDDLKDYNKNNHPDFLIHTGDICYEKGMQFHAANINTKTMGLPVYYCIGNHDLVKGKYGEELYESLFGPTYYSFEAGNVHFVVTPMLNGDYKPAYTKKDVYEWLKNDLKMKPAGQPVVIFNHDLLDNIDDSQFVYHNKFIYGISDIQQINLNNNNLIAWIYGHWHTEMIKQHGNILSVCTSPPDKGGIDHSISSFRLITVNEKGRIHIDTRYTYQHKQLEIVTPNADMFAMNNDGSLVISANTYNTASPVESVKYAVIKNDEKHEWKNMKQQSSWNWQATWKPQQSSKASYKIIVTATAANGDTVTRSNVFQYTFHSNFNIKTGDNWPMLLQNIAHHPALKITAMPALKLAWIANAKAPVYNASPLIIGNTVITATIDEGNLNEGKIIAFNAINGKMLWQYKTENAVKGAIASAANKVFATDVGGKLYAVNILTGRLQWQKQLDFDFLPSNLVGVIVSNDTVYAGSGKGLFALKANDGAVIWKNDSWRRSDGSTANQTLAGNVLIGSSNWSALFANNAASGKLLWKRNDEGLRFRDAALSYTDGKLYATGGTRFFELNPADGKNIRSKELPFGPSGVKSFSTPLVTGDAFIFGTGTNGVVALDKQTLDIKWQFKTQPSLIFTAPYTKPQDAAVESSPVKIGTNIFFGASDGNLYMVDETTGELKWKTTLGAPVLASPTVSGKLLVVADFSGTVYGFVLN